MVKLNFSSFGDYADKLHQYLKNEGITDLFHSNRLNGIKSMVDALDMKNHVDVDQLSFLLWMKKEDFVSLLNTGYLMLKIDLNYFKRVLLACNPSVSIIGNRGITPLGGPVCTTTRTIGYYDCLKFIGQFTDFQDVYDACLHILNALPRTVDGPIMNPPDVMYLMNYNPNENIDTSNNRYKSKVDQHIDKLHSFNGSVWQPDPSHEQQYNRYKVDLQRAYHKMGLEMCEKKDKDGGSITDQMSDSDIPYICMVDLMVNSHYHVIEDSDSLKRFYALLDDLPFKKLEDILIKISQTVLEPKKVLTDEEKKIKDSEMRKRIVDSKMRFLNKNDDKEMISIGIDAYIYVSDDAYEKEALKRDMLMALYERKLANTNSKFSHNLMRNAVESGRLWLVKFLIAQGVPTKNLPRYGGWAWCLESQSLNEILDREVTDCSNFGRDWVNEKIANKAAVKNYLISCGVIE